MPDSSSPDALSPPSPLACRASHRGGMGVRALAKPSVAQRVSAARRRMARRSAVPRRAALDSGGRGSPRGVVALDASKRRNAQGREC